MSFPAYPSYRDSGVEWLSEVPSSWSITPLKRVIRFQTGWTPPTGRDDLYGDGNTWVTIGDLSGRTIRESSKQITDEAARLVGISPSPKGSLLFSFKLSIGQVAFAAKDLYTNEAIATFLPSPDVDLSYAYYAFPEFVVRNASENIYGAKLLNQELIREAKLALPPLPEQTAIAAFLDRETAKIDALVAEQRRLIDLLKEKRQAVISHAVTKGLDPTVPMKDSGVEWLGNVPANWCVTPLKYLTALRSGGTPSKENKAFWGGDVPWASAKDLKSEVIEDTIDHLTAAAIEEGAATLLPAGSIIVLVRGMMLARMFPVCETGLAMAINQDLKALLPKSEISGPFLAWLLRGTAPETLSRLDEAGHGTKALRMEAWTCMPLPVPPVIEQVEIVEHVIRATSAIDDLSDQAQAAISLLQERRVALISATVTGKIDVRSAAVQQAEAA